MSGPVRAEAEAAPARPRRLRPKGARLRRRASIPEPREILAAPGHPLEPGVQRVLEERLGQDFSQVRIHADADAAGLTELLGADAVAVGSDVFFAAGRYRPETVAGLRLLAHELMHTVQAPDGGSRLRVGRDSGPDAGFGAVSDPLEPLELAAEKAADSVAGGAGSGREAGGEAAAGAGNAGSTAEASAAGSGSAGSGAASWLRYASVTAEQRRTEQLDPATLLDRLVAGVLRSLRGDPADASGRARMQLARMPMELRASVLTRIEQRLPSTEYADLVERIEESDGSYDAGAAAAGETPEPIWSAEEDLERKRQNQQDQSQQGQNEQSQNQPGQNQPGQNQPGQNQPGQNQSGQNQPGQNQQSDGRPSQGPQSEDQQNEDQQNEGPQDEDQQNEDKQNDDQQNEGQQDAEQAEQDLKDDQEKNEQEDKDKTEQDQKEQQDENAKDKDKKQKDAESPAEGEPEGEAGPGEALPPSTAAQPGALGQTGPAAPPGPAGASPEVASAGGSGVEAVSAAPVEQELTGDQSPLVRHGVLARRGQTEMPSADELPLGLEPAAADEIALPDVEPSAEAESDPGPPPDLLPAGDLDVSTVPSAEDDLKLPASGAPPSPKSVPSFPAPPRLSPEAETYLAEEAAGPSAQASQERVDDDESRQAAGEFEHPELSSGADPVAPADPVQDPVGSDAGPGADSASLTSSGSDVDAGPGGSAPGFAAEPAFDSGPASSQGPGVDNGQGPGFDNGQGPGFDQGPGLDAGATFGPGANLGADTGTGPGAAEPGPGALPQDASLEPGGGECGGGPVSEPAETGAAACGAGGAPAAEPAAADPAPPDVSAEEPESGLSAVEQLPPDQMQTTLVGVNSAVTTTVGQQRTDLAESPPQLDRPAGAPQTLHGEPTVAAPGEYPGDKVQKIRAAHPGQTPEVEGAQGPSGDNPADHVDTPGLLDVGKAILGAIVGSIAGKVEKALGILPTKDPGLQNATVGVAGKVPLKDDTDPNLADQQKDRVLATGGQLRQAGQRDAAQPMGENQVYPDVPPEVMRADVGAGTSSGAGAGPGAAPAGTGASAKATGIIAAQERGPDIQAGFVQGRTQMGTERQNQQTSTDQAQADHEQAVAAEIAAGTEEQATVRAGTLTEVGEARQSWNEEQAGHLQTLEGKAGESATKARTEIQGQQEKADTDIEHKTTEENNKIVTARTTAEQEATQKKDEGKKESGNWLSRAWDAIKDAFNAVKNAIKSAFDKARKAVGDIVEGFKKAAFAIIDAARNLIIAAINTVADALIAIGDVALAAFPEARDKWRAYINGKRDAAIKTVNEAADKLKETVAKALDAFGKLLTSILDVLEAGLLAAVALVEAAVSAAVKFAEGLIALVGQWAELVVDIAANPGGWLGNLGTAAKEGVQNHLWGALKTAVRQWFDQKVESVLGLGKMLWNVLIKGCMSVQAIGKMAWQAVLSALPMILIGLVIEKLVSLIVPAAGAIMTIIQGLIAAWGSISRIIAAFSTFFAFLKSVKNGGVTAACLFAQSVAAGAVVLLDFIANFLLIRLGRALKSVASKLKGLAQKVMKGLKRGGKGKKRAAGGAVNNARNNLKRAGANSKRDIEAVPRNRRRGSGRRRAGDRAPGSRRNPLARARQAVTGAARRARDTARRLGNRFRRSSVGRALSNGPRRLKDWYRKQKQRYQDRRNRARERNREKANRDKAGTKEDRLQRIIARLKGPLGRLLRRGTPRRALNIVLGALRRWYRLKLLDLQGHPASAIWAALNPGGRAASADELDDDDILRIVQAEIEEFEQSDEIRRQANRVQVSTRPSADLDRQSFRADYFSGGRGKFSLPAVLTQLHVPQGVSFAGLASRIRSMVGNNRVTRRGERLANPQFAPARVFSWGGTPRVPEAALLAMSTRQDQQRRVPAGHLTPLDIVNNNPNSPRFQRIPGLSSYPGFPELIQRNPPKVLRAAQLLAEGDSQAAFALVRGILKPSELAQVAGVPMFAEPGRFPLAGVTGRLGFQQAEYSPDPGAVIAGLPGGEVGAQEPAQRMSRRLRQQAELSDRGSQYAARLEASVIRRERFSEIPREERAAMSEAERRQHLAPSREEVELLRPHHVSERSLANKMLQLLGRAGILDGLVTEPGGKPRQEALLRKRIRDFLESS